MTQINFDFGKLDATGIVDLANDSISVTPTSRFATATKKIVVDELHVGAGTPHEFKVTFDVPDSANPVNFADLVTVDPATLIPNAGNPLSDIDQSDIDWAVDAINA